MCGKNNFLPTLVDVFLSPVHYGSFVRWKFTHLTLDKLARSLTGRLELPVPRIKTTSINFHYFEKNVSNYSPYLPGCWVGLVIDFKGDPIFESAA